MIITQELPTEKLPGRPSKYPFNQMQPGDCLTIKDQSKAQYLNAVTAMYNFKRRNGLTWKTQVRFDNNTTSIYRLS